LAQYPSAGLSQPDAQLLSDPGPLCKKEKYPRITNKIRKKKERKKQSPPVCNTFLQTPVICS
jgi:hypothetical protein